ncbi:proton-coupled amino acid transporter-like protein acs [Arctopsyche grandis]|uniref:proton-coupled amino acid transporter-like protein acs n=1 Tax=Arctopsyche grandis TaxID=121162 RepID=UPI00406D8CEA
MEKLELTNGKEVEEDVTKIRGGPQTNCTFETDEISLKSLSHQNGNEEHSVQAIVNIPDKKNGANQDDYDPYANRTIKHPTTNTETLIHLLKGSLGTGILAMPNAFSHAGWLVGIVGTILIGLLCTYCIHVLIKAEYELCKRRRVPSLTYPQVAEEALKEGPNWCKAVAPYAGHVVNAFLLIYQIGTCCVYVVFVSENIKSVVDLHMGVETSIKLYMTIILLPLIFINWVRSLKYLAPFSSLANAITIVSFGIILYYIMREVPTFEGKEALGHVSEFPLFFGTVLFALEAIGVMLPLENEMKTPQAFGGTTGVLNRGMVTIVILYVLIGFLGYLQYGDKSAGSVTLNLPSNTEVLAQVVQCTLAFAIFITHAIACYVAIDIAWNAYIKNKLPGRKHLFIYEYVVRTVIVILTYLLAVAVPALDLFISLFGALCLSALGLAIPALIQTCVWWNYITRNEKILMSIKNTIVGVFGIVGLVVGTYTSLKAIIHEFS